MQGYTVYLAVDVSAENAASAADQVRAGLADTSLDARVEYVTDDDGEEGYPGGPDDPAYHRELRAALKDATPPALSVLAGE